MNWPEKNRVILDNHLAMLEDEVVDCRRQLFVDAFNTVTPPPAPPLCPMGHKGNVPPATPRIRGKNITPEERAKILEQHKTGNTLAQIAQDLGRSRTTVQRAIAKAAAEV